ncbi:hypothetical protein [Streptomyces sp. NPDC001880]
MTARAINTSWYDNLIAQAEAITDTTPLEAATRTDGDCATSH